MHIRGEDQDLFDRNDLALDHIIFALDVFLDVEGAFDNISFEAIGRAYGDHEVHSTI
jgi:hypothetical protein